jgi:hypothetical protein
MADCDGSVPDMLARFALAKYGVSAKDVKLATVGGDRDSCRALIAGVVDAAVVSNEVEFIREANFGGASAIPSKCNGPSGTCPARRSRQPDLANHREKIRYSIFYTFQRSSRRHNLDVRHVPIIHTVFPTRKLFEY